MNKIIDLFKNTILLMVLVIIFIVPLLISFNLDPHVKNPESKEASVSGITDIRTSRMKTFDFEIEQKEYPHVTLTETLQSAGPYSMQVALEQSNEQNFRFSLGTISNISNYQIPLSAYIMGDRKSLEKLRISLILLDEKKYNLFKNNEYNEVSFQLGLNAHEELDIEISSKTSINYPVEFTVVLEENKNNS